MKRLIMAALISLSLLGVSYGQEKGRGKEGPPKDPCSGREVPIDKQDHPEPGCTDGSPKGGEGDKGGRKGDGPTPAERGGHPVD